MKIYFTIDNKSRVIPCCDWDAKIKPNVDWFIGEMPGIAYNSYGIPLWKYVHNQILARTIAEIEQDIAELPHDDPSPVEYLQADVDFLLMENEYLEEQNEQQQADIDFCLMMLDE